MNKHVVEVALRVARWCFSFAAILCLIMVGIFLYVNHLEPSPIAIPLIITFGSFALFFGGFAIWLIFSKCK